MITSEKEQTKTIERDNDVNKRTALGVELMYVKSLVINQKED